MSCNRLIADVDVENIYNGIQLINRVKVLSSCQDNDSKKSLINIYNENNSVINRSEVQRFYYDNWMLINSALTGKVAKHFIFFMNDEFRGKGLATKIHTNELNIYVTNNFKQIHLDAVWDGVIVWHKLGFKYKFEFSENTIVLKWKEYMNSELGYEGDEYFDIIKGVSKVSQIKRKYLRPTGQKSFTDWLYEHEFCQEVPMYKNVA